jgi:hypothetical protein
MLLKPVAATHGLCGHDYDDFCNQHLIGRFAHQQTHSLINLNQRMISLESTADAPPREITQRVVEQTLSQLRPVTSDETVIFLHSTKITGEEWSA